MSCSMRSQIQTSSHAKGRQQLLRGLAWYNQLTQANISVCEHLSWVYFHGY